jgi:hypothetical protein
MQPPLLQDFGYLGIGHNAEAVMNGIYHPPPGVDQYTSKQMNPDVMGYDPNAY